MKTYHIHWTGQPQPDAVPFTSYNAAVAAAKEISKIGEQYTIIEIGPRGWPRDYKEHPYRYDG